MREWNCSERQLYLFHFGLFFLLFPILTDFLSHPDGSCFPRDARFFQCFFSKSVHLSVLFAQGGCGVRRLNRSCAPLYFSLISHFSSTFSFRKFLPLRCDAASGRPSDGNLHLFLPVVCSYLSLRACFFPPLPFTSRGLQRFLLSTWFTIFRHLFLPRSQFIGQTCFDVFPLRTA